MGELIGVATFEKNGLLQKEFSSLCYYNNGRDNVNLCIGTFLNIGDYALSFDYAIDNVSSTSHSKGTFKLFRHPTVNNSELTGAIFKNVGDASIYINKQTGAVYVKLIPYQYICLKTENIKVKSGYNINFIPDMKTKIDTIEGLTLLS